MSRSWLHDYSLRENGGRHIDRLYSHNSPDIAYYWPVGLTRPQPPEKGAVSCGKFSAKAVHSCLELEIMGKISERVEATCRKWPSSCIGSMGVRNFCPQNTIFPPPSSHSSEKHFPDMLFLEERGPIGKRLERAISDCCDEETGKSQFRSRSASTHENFRLDPWQNGDNVVIAIYPETTQNRKQVIELVCVAVIASGFALEVLTSFWFQNLRPEFVKPFYMPEGDLKRAVPSVYIYICTCVTIWRAASSWHPLAWNL